MDKRLTAVIAIVITAAWAVSFLVDIVNPRYEVPAGIHPLMLIVAGAAFGGAVFGKDKKQGGDEK